LEVAFREEPGDGLHPRVLSRVLLIFSIHTSIRLGRHGCRPACTSRAFQPGRPPRPISHVFLRSLATCPRWNVVPLAPRGDLYGVI
jgi:hypothetical protein